MCFFRQIPTKSTFFYQGESMTKTGPTTAEFSSDKDRQDNDRRVFRDIRTDEMGNVKPVQSCWLFHPAQVIS